MTLKKLLFLLAVTFAAKFATAQKAELSGVVKDTSSNAQVKNAVVLLLSPKDSVLSGFTRVNADGSYSIPNVKPGKYILSVTHPVFAEFVDDIEVKSENTKLPLIALTPKSKLLEAVIVKSAAAIRVKGDTTIFAADSFKVSANANVEELLKKLPGIQVDKNGQIKAMGETVERVLVDGEEFFGNDPGMAVKNLRADAVKEVQVFDKKSDQAEFTGIDDGKTQKTINLKLKEDKKKGYFGKIDAAGGLQKNIDDRYNTNILASSFKGKRKISGFFLNGNTGQDGLDWQDEQKYSGESDNVTMSMDDDGNTMYMWRGGGSDEEPYLDPQNGFITNMNAGLSYSNKWNDKTTLNFSPKYNKQDYSNHKQTFSQTLLQGDSALNENSGTFTKINRYNTKLRATYDIKLDSMNTLKLTANTNFYHTESEETRSGYTTDQAGRLINTSTRDFKTDNDKTAISANAIFKHKFKKLRRTLSATVDFKNLETEGTNFLKSNNNAVVVGTTQNIDQMKDFSRSNTDVVSRLVYTEPLGKKYSMEIGYQLGFNHGNNDQTTFDRSPVTDKYEVKVDTLSNLFRQTITVQSPSAKINYSYKKLKMNIGAGVAFTDFRLKDLSFGNIYDRNYTNFFPSASLNYSYKSNHSLRFNYSGSTKQPTIDQLQPLRNNNDQFNQYIGNPDLKPSFSNRFNINHNSYNFLKDLWTYAGMNVNFTQNAITNKRTVIYNEGKTISQPINTNGNMNVGFWGGGGFKVKKIDTRFNFNPNVNYNKTADIINDVKTYSKNLSAGMSVYISKSKEKKYDFSISSDLSYNSNKTSQSINKVHYITNTLGLNGTVYYKKVWSIISDYQLYTRQKTQQAAAFDNSLWNARLQRTFKSDEFTAYVTVRDILNQNKGIDRDFYSNTFTETRNDRLQRYFLVGFTWNFKNKAATPKP